jgi:hypothetical protein
MDPDTVAQILAQHRGEVKGPWETLGKPIMHGLFGNPEAKVQVPVTENGTPMDMNLSPSEFQAEYGVQHPVVDAGLQGGMMATGVGAPQLMSRALFPLIGNAFKAGVKSAPLTTAAITGAAANTAIPSNSGKTQWEMMQDQWEARRQAYRDKIAAEDNILSTEADKLQMSPAEQASIEKIKTDLIGMTNRYEQFKAKGQAGVKGQEDVPAAKRLAAQITAANANIDRMQNRGGEIESQKKVSEGITGPARERRAAAEQGMSDVDKEIEASQTPIRQAHPLAAAASLPVAWGIGSGGGYLLGKGVKAVQAAKANKMNDLIERTTQHIADTTGGRGVASKFQFKNAEGSALTNELAAMSGKPRSTNLMPFTGAGVGGLWGAAEGGAVPAGFTVGDAMLAPTGSPRQENASEAMLHLPWWKQAAPEIGLNTVLGALGGWKGVKSGGGPPLLPQERLNSLALVSRAAQSPKTMSAAGKDVASAQKSIQAAKAAPAKKGSAKSKAAPPSNNVPDL